ncbi:MAG TPA: hypothetical protein VFX89_12700 [Gammaproteobacteria bacterium]|nr:hypothetical protein [Gammaproteobacteria bacterium]
MSAPSLTNAQWMKPSYVNRSFVRYCAVPAALCAMLFAFAASAEPYLAVESGLKCMNCHVNPSGGGKRKEFGTLYARTQISANAVTLDSERKPWTGDITKWFAGGADVRADYQSVDIPGSPTESDTELERASVYAEFRAIPNLLSVYIDEKIAPDDAEMREGYVLLTPKQGKYTIKAGQMFLPFGLRLQDDDAFVRQSSGINFRTPEDGVELGLELPKWSTQLAMTDGSASGGMGSLDRLSLSSVYVKPRWRVGASVNSNDDPLGDRTMVGVFGGWKTGPIAWLAELDFIKDKPSSGDHDSYASLLEGNWRLHKGHNLKVSYEFLDPNRDRGEDQQERYSLVWEYSPIQFVQSRVGLRRYNGIPNFTASNRDEVFAELHVYF